MAKSAASCLRIIACGSDSVNEDGHTLPQSKASSSRHIWSFRKRSTRHQVLSNSVVSEVPTFANKESQESTTASNSQLQPNLTFPGDTSVVQTTREKNELLAKHDSSLSDGHSAREDDCGADATIDLSSIITIQTAVRGYLAQQVLLKQKHAIKLQAAVRGHLVRRHAVGTLRCIQAIIKMQILVRQRRTCLLEEGTGTHEKQNGDNGKGTPKPMLLGSEAVAQPNVTSTCTSIEKILSNKFARQLMESTQRTQPINIKCEPLKSDSTWKWLQRWMLVSSTINDEPPHKFGSAGLMHVKEDSEHSEEKGNILVQSGYRSDPKDFEPGMRSSDETSENNDLITYDSDKFDLHARLSISPASSHSKLQHIDGLDSGHSITQPDPTGMIERVIIPKVDVKSLPDNKDGGNKQNKQWIPETETEKFLQKKSNSTSVATPSKHEERSSATTSSNLTTSLSDSPGVQSNFYSVSTGPQPPYGSREIGLASASINSAIQVARSECGTELSISSTLDSPERLESGANALEQETKMLDETDHPESREKSGLEAKGNSYILGTELSYPNINELESYDDTDSSQLEKNLESDQSYLNRNLESDVSHLAPQPSPEASTGVTEYQATPNGPMSVEPEKTKGEKREAKLKKKRPLSSTTPPNHNSPSRSSSDYKSRKKHSAFGSGRTDHVHQEPRDSISSNSLPSYMKATESARAKVVSNGSPRPSVDMQDKDRDSPSGKNARQDSPHVHRSLSLAQENAKGTGAHSPQERKWRL